MVTNTKDNFSKYDPINFKFVLLVHFIFRQNILKFNKIHFSRMVGR